MENEQEMQMGRTGGHIQSPIDYRYVNVEHLAGGAPEAPLEGFHIDYTAIPDVYQRKIGACTCHAACEVRMHRELRLTGQIKRYSPRFTYTLSKINDGIADPEEQGTMPVMPLKMGVKFGFATEDTCPNDTTLDFHSYIYHRDVRNIPEAAFAEADKNRIPGYAQVGGFNSVSIAQLAHGLANGQDGVKTCLEVGREWYTAKDGTVTWEASKIIPIRKCVVPESGHDITITGVAPEQGTGRWQVFFRNHWSKGWADNDNGWFYFDEHPLREAWIITEIPDALIAIIKALPDQKTFSHAWAVDLHVGSKGPDVQALQIALKIAGAFPFNQPATDYYGNMTAAAVMAFQKQYNVATADQIAAAAGALGPKTRSTLNNMFAHK